MCILTIFARKNFRTSKFLHHKILPVEMVVLTLERFWGSVLAKHILFLSRDVPLKGALSQSQSKSCRALERSTLKMAQCFLTGSSF